MTNIFTRPLCRFPLYKKYPEQKRHIFHKSIAIYHITALPEMLLPSQMIVSHQGITDIGNEKYEVSVASTELRVYQIS
jgi:hypothetical protein